MSLEQFAPSRRKAFVFIEHLGGESFEAHSCGNGRFIQGAPSSDLEICFKFRKGKNWVEIYIYDDNLLQWLRAIPSVREELDNGIFDIIISMDRLLPHYPEMSAKFDQDRIRGHSFDALDLFVRHFLREGSVFATFGFELLHERQILTELHFHDIQSQDRSLSEDLDLLDEAIDEIDERDIKGPSHYFPFMNETLQSRLRTAIRWRDHIAVDNVLATMHQSFVNAKTLCHAIRYYDRTVFRRLLEHGAQVDGVGIITEPLYRAAKAGNMDAVQLLLSYGANKEGGNSSISATPLSGAASGGHLEIVQYLVDQKGVKINGIRHKSPLSRAIKHRHTRIIDYLLRAGANVHEENRSVLLRIEQAELGDIRERIIAGMDNDARNLLFSRVLSEGHLEIVRCLVAAGTNVNLDKRHYNATGGFDIYCREHSLPLAVAASNGYLEIVRCLVAAGANVNPDPLKYNSADDFVVFNREQSSPLEATIGSGHLEIVRFLVAAGANVNPDKQHCNGRKDRYSICNGEYVHSSPLTVAASEGHLEIIHCLIAAGAHVNPDPPKYDTAQNFVECSRNHRSPLEAAIGSGHLEIVRCLIEAGANVNPDLRHCITEYEGSRSCRREHSSPLAVAASKGYLEIAHCLVEAGAIINPSTWRRDTSNGDNSTLKKFWCSRPHYSPLAAAIKSNETEVAQFLSSIGATLLAGEDKIHVLHRPMSVGEFHNIIEQSLNDCPALAAIQAQERRAMAHRLLTKVASSCEKLLDASIMQDASAGVIAFVDQFGTSASIWKSGTRAIRDICEGYMPRSLSDIVSALQVANAMRSAVPPSTLGYSKKEFIDDIPRWASLLSSDDQRLFFEIASYLWGIPASTVPYEMADSLTTHLMSLQDIVKYLVRTSGLFDYGSENSYRLQTLRQQYPFGTSPTRTCERRLTLAEWHPLPKQEVQESPPTNVPKPPDPEEQEFSILARITVLMAGAIFGAILLYLCLSRYGFSTLCLPILASDAGQSWAASDKIITRNSAILARYVGLTSPVDFESWKSTDHLLPKPSPLSLVLPDNLPTEGVLGHMAAIQASYEGDYPMIGLSR
ncbi:hypothetical protein Trihar35433_10024 [Trichoderma harzianum]|nr:hypothetical protein Trihar35433_10024 [Trichoderma harzianum]